MAFFTTHNFWNLDCICAVTAVHIIHVKMKYVNFCWSISKFDCTVLWNLDFIEIKPRLSIKSRLNKKSRFHCIMLRKYICFKWTDLNPYSTVLLLSLFTLAAAAKAHSAAGSAVALPWPPRDPTGSVAAAPFEPLPRPIARSRSSREGTARLTNWKNT